MDFREGSGAGDDGGGVVAGVKLELVFEIDFGEGDEVGGVASVDAPAVGFVRGGGVGAGFRIRVGGESGGGSELGVEEEGDVAAGVELEEGGGYRVAVGEGELGWEEQALGSPPAAEGCVRAFGFGAGCGVAEDEAGGGVVEGGAPFFDEVPAEEAVDGMAELLAEVGEVGDEGVLFEDGELRGMEGEADGLITALRGSGTESVERDGSLPERGVDFAFAGDRGGEGGALEAGVEHEDEGAKVFIGEGDVKVAAGVVEGEDDGIILCGQNRGEKQR